MIGPVAHAPGNDRGSLRLQVRQETPIRLDALLECAPGQMLAIVGPSGSGKTTLLRSIAGLHQPQTGQIHCGKQVWLDVQAGIDLPTQRRRVGMVFQDYGLFPHLDALDNIALAVGGGLNADTRRRAGALLDLVHMSGLAHRRPGHLSGGQQQRVALARALAREPAVLLLDEPFAAVDQQTRARLVQELAHLRRQLEMPVILVTHDLDEARILADRMCVLDHGATLQTDAPETLIARPASARVARLLGMDNIFVARVAAHVAERGTTLLAWNGITLESGLHGDLPVGSLVEWLLHPEFVHVATGHEGSALDGNRLQGEVEDCLVLGHHCVLTIQFGPSGGTASVRTWSRVPPRRGDIVQLEVPRNAVHVLDGPG